MPTMLPGESPGRSVTQWGVAAAFLLVVLGAVAGCGGLVAVAGLGLYGTVLGCNRR